MAGTGSFLRTRARLSVGVASPALAFVLPALFGMSVLFDLIALWQSETPWPLFAYWNIAGGVAMAALVGALGLLAFLGLPSGTRQSKVSLGHVLASLSSLGFGGASFILRTADRALTPSSFAQLFAAAAFVCALVAAFTSLASRTLSRAT